MKKFTLKDFAQYNGPCFSCGSKIDLIVLFTNPDEVDRFLRPDIYPDRIQLNLHIGYVSTLTLVIFHDTNKIVVSDKKLVAEYLADRQLFLSTKCPKCGTWVSSQTLQFDIDREVMRAFPLRKEVLILTEKARHYRLTTVFETGETQVAIHKILASEECPHTVQNYFLDSASKLEFTLPLLPLYQIKTRQALLSKLKTYIVFG